MCLNQTEWDNNNKFVKYEIRQLDAWLYDGGWTVNESYHIGEYKTKTDDKRAFLHALHKLGIVCKRGYCRVIFDGDFFVLEERKTNCPLFCAVPLD